MREMIDEGNLFAAAGESSSSATAGEGDPHYCHNTAASATSCEGPDAQEVGAANGDVCDAHGGAAPGSPSGTPLAPPFPGCDASPPRRLPRDGGASPVQDGGSGASPVQDADPVYGEGRENAHHGEKPPHESDPAVLEALQAALEEEARAEEESECLAEHSGTFLDPFRLRSGAARPATFCSVRGRSHQGGKRRGVCKKAPTFRADRTRCPHA